MRLPRLFGLMLLLVLLVPIIVACGGGGTGEQTETAAPVVEEPAATEPPAAEEPAATEPPAAEEPAATEPPAAEEPAATEPPAAEEPAATTTTAAGGDSGAAPGGPNLAALQIEEGAELVVTSWGDASEQKINQDSFDRFQELYPNVKITYQPTPSDYQTKLKADAAGGTLADVFYVDSALMTAFAPNGVLLDLTPYMQQAGVNKDDYVGQLASIFEQEGKVYGLPKDQGALALFVRNDLAEQAGVDPNSITSWDAWREAAEKMTSGEGNAKVFGQCSSSDIQRVGALMIQNNAQPVADNKANVAAPEAVEAVEFWYTMFKDGYGAIPGDIGAGWCGEAFAKGQTAMALEGGWMISFLAKDYADVEYTALPIPTPEGGKQASLVFTNAWGAKADTQYPNAAAALVLYLTSAQNQKPILETGFALPTVQSLLDDPYFETHAAEKVLAEAGGYGTPADFAFGGPAKKEDVIKPLNQAMERIWLGQGDVKSNLDQAVQEADQILSAQ